jgi:polysaccharide pyruvyl transferase WcaK-like protein
MRFFLYGYYGQGNLGDDLLLRACVVRILDICPDARFVVRAGKAATGLEALRVPFEVAEVDEVVADQGRSKLARLFSALAAYRRHLRRCDWLVFGGGTIFHERQSPLPLILLLLICLMARAMGLRIAALGVGVAELKSRVALATLRRIILLSDVFAVRDEAALLQCQRAGASRRVAITGDLAFALDSAGGGVATKGADAGRVIGFSVYPPALQGNDTARTTRLALQEAIDRLGASGCTIRLLALHHAPDPAVGDEVVLARLAAGLHEARRLRTDLIRLSKEASVVASTFAELDLLCGMRFHGHVLAAIHGVPFVGIAADNKIEAICRLFDMPVLAADGLEADEIIASITATLSRKPDRAVVDRCVAMAQQNFVLLGSALSGRRPRGRFRVETSRL